MARCTVPLHLRIHLKIQADKQKIVLLRNADRSDKLIKGSADPLSKLYIHLKQA